MPGIEPVREHVSRLARGLEADDRVERIARDARGRIGASVRRARRRRAGPRQHAVVMGGSGRQAPWGFAPSASPCHGHTSRPSRTQPAPSEAPMCGQASGAARRVGRRARRRARGRRTHDAAAAARRSARARPPRTSRRTADAARRERARRSTRVGLLPVGAASRAARAGAARQQLRARQRRRGRGRSRPASARSPRGAPTRAAPAARPAERAACWRRGCRRRRRAP